MKLPLSSIVILRPCKAWEPGHHKRCGVGLFQMQTTFQFFGYSFACNLQVVCLLKHCDSRGKHMSPGGHWCCFSGGSFGRETWTTCERAERPALRFGSLMTVIRRMMSKNTIPHRIHGTDIFTYIDSIKIILKYLKYLNVAKYNISPMDPIGKQRAWIMDQNCRRFILLFE